MHLAVRDQDGARTTAGRYVRQAVLDGPEELRTAVSVTRAGTAGAQHAHIEIAQPLQPLLQLPDRRLGLRPALADGLARGFVDNEQGDVTLAVALLLDQRRVAEREQQRGEHQPAPPHALGAAGEPEADEQQRQEGERRDGLPRHQRREGDLGGDAVHSPSRCRIAGTCT